MRLGFDYSALRLEDVCCVVRQPVWKAGVSFGVLGSTPTSSASLYAKDKRVMENVVGVVPTLGCYPSQSFGAESSTLSFSALHPCRGMVDSLRSDRRVCRFDADQGYHAQVTEWYTFWS